MESIREGIGYEKIGMGKHFYTSHDVVSREFCENLFHFSFREAKGRFLEKP